MQVWKAFLRKAFPHCMHREEMQGRPCTVSLRALTVTALSFPRALGKL